MHTGPTETNISSMVLELACQEALDSGSAYFPNTGTIPVTVENVWERASSQGIAEGEFKAAIEQLYNKGYLERKRTGGLPRITIRFRGFDEYAKSKYNMSELEEQVFSRAIPGMNSKQVADMMKLPLTLTQHVLLRLERKGRLSVDNREHGTLMPITKVSR